MIHKTIVVGPFQCNCVILACEKTKEAIVIDPGDEADRILEEISHSDLKVKYLLHTHAHLDHVGATGKVHTKTLAPSCLHKDDQFLYDHVPMQGQLFGLNYDAPPKVGHYIEDLELIQFGEIELEVLHTPGHSPGSVCFRVTKGPEMLFSGDTLFKQSVGRTDLWGGDHRKLVHSIKERILVLDGDLKVYPGHGPSTRIGEEKKSNPFL